MKQPQAIFTRELWSKWNIIEIPYTQTISLKRRKAKLELLITNT